MSKALQQVWEQGGPRPDPVWLRVGFLLADKSGSERPAAPTARLLTSRGIALRFYLLALFEAQCRQQPGEPWTNPRPLSARMGWCDLIAVDAAYSRETKTYLHSSRPARSFQTKNNGKN